MTISVALFNCPHCIDEFAFDHRRIANLAYGWRVRVRCPGCVNVVEVVMLAYSLIHGADAAKYQWGEILQILPPDPNTSKEAIRRNIQLHYEIYQKRSNWRPGWAERSESTAHVEGSRGLFRLLRRIRSA